MESDPSADGTLVASDDPEVPDGTTDGVDIDDLFRVLSRPANRFVLYYLIKVERPVSVTELVEYVVTAVEDYPDSMTAGEFRGRVSSQLFHSTLPNLDAMGLLEYDEDGRVVRPTAKTSVAQPYLALALEHRR
jgi:predicted transcriptional regulator